MEINDKDGNWAFQQRAFRDGKLHRDLLRYGATPTGYRFSTEYEDCQLATDLVLETKVGAMGMRLRDVTGKDDDQIPWWSDVTIRSRLPSRLPTELQKLTAPNCDVRWYLYGWFDKGTGGKLRKRRCMIYDVRAALGMGLARAGHTSPGGNKFVVILTADLEQKGLIKASWPGHWAVVKDPGPFQYKRQLSLEDPVEPDWVSNPFRARP